MYKRKPGNSQSQSFGFYSEHLNTAKRVKSATPRLPLIGGLHPSISTMTSDVLYPHHAPLFLSMNETTTLPFSDFTNQPFFLKQCPALRLLVLQAESKQKHFCEGARYEPNERMPRLGEWFVGTLILTKGFVKTAGNITRELSNKWYQNNNLYDFGL
ncbi:hypothetical protein [Geobacillus thermodenitrificans]|uniref:hypothetical protein n=1 Tax=Geobacillus thermodenitrificans TaxID=33940 RepID=UPI0011D10E80|nr:hypothetical protein [Geobacillus thermodenitrificans]